MDNSKKIRLIQVAKEFKVGFNTLADFLQRKGLQSDCSPSSPVSPDVYAVLEKEFGHNRVSGNERNAVRERIQQKGSVSITSQKEDETEAEEVVVKSNVISVKDEVRGPKILGKIDLNPKKEEPKREEPKKAEPKREEPKPVPAPKVEEPMEEPKRDSVYRPQVSQLDGPKILGTMDVSNMVPGGKHKRKRLEKEKVNVAKEGKNAGKPEKNNGNNNNKGGNQQAQQNQQAGKKNKKQKQQPKPVVRPEVSDEEVQKQIKDTLARLTAKGTKSKGAKYRKEKREEVRERMNEEIEREEMERSVLNGGYLGMYEPRSYGIYQPASRC